jgi:hypothetical protein
VCLRPKQNFKDCSFLTGKKQNKTKLLLEAQTVKKHRISPAHSDRFCSKYVNMISGILLPYRQFYNCSEIAGIEV